MGKTQLENFHYVHATQYVTSRMKTAGKKFCSLCLAERVNIFIAIHSEGSNNGRPKQFPNKVNTGPKGPRRLICSPGKMLASCQQTIKQRVN